MKAARSVLVVLATRTLRLSFAVQAEDSRETAYDESEALPYEGSALFSVNAAGVCPGNGCGHM